MNMEDYLTIASIDNEVALWAWKQVGKGVISKVKYLRCNQSDSYYKKSVVLKTLHCIYPLFAIVCTVLYLGKETLFVH